jgi:uncharacterized membrane protein
MPKLELFIPKSGYLSKFPEFWRIKINGILNQDTTLARPTATRLIFIDALRAFAILMMLQGHFVDSLLADAYRIPESHIFSTWLFMRGLTAPIFFTASGIIFVFLLMKDGRPSAENIRVKKGLRRGLMLLGLGYILKFNLFALLLFRFYDSFITVDVLHCIGIAILMLVGTFILAEKIYVPFPLLLGLGGIGIFLLSTIMARTNWEFLPVLLQNYVSRANGSVFTPVPWVGFTMLGGVLGWHIHKRTGWYLTIWPGIALMLTGIWLHLSSTQGLRNLYAISQLGIFAEIADNNWIFWRLGHVLMVIALFTWAARIFYRYIPPLFLTIGSETLTIYSVHYVLLYGTWTGLGIVNTIGYRTLGPISVTIGAAIFVASFVILVYYLEPIRAWIDQALQPWLRGKLRAIGKKVKLFQFFEKELGKYARKSKKRNNHGGF